MMTTTHRLSSTDGVDKAGYIDVKFAAKDRGRGKAWNRRWVVIKKLRCESTVQAYAKLDIYPTEEAWRKGKSNDRITQVLLESVKHIKRISSTTHDHAFVIVADDRKLFLAAPNETETQDWMQRFRDIFIPRNGRMRLGSYSSTIRPRSSSAIAELFEVTVIDNAFSKEGLNGEYQVFVSDEMLHLLPTRENQRGFDWRLSTIRSFVLSAANPDDEGKVLDIIIGPNTNQVTYKFFCTSARKLLDTIWANIYEAINKRTQNYLDVPKRLRSKSEESGGSDYGSRNGTPTRQSAGPVVPEVLAERMEIARQSHSYHTLQRSWQVWRQTSTLSETSQELPASLPNKSNLEDDAPIYSQLDESVENHEDSDESETDVPAGQESHEYTQNRIFLCTKDEAPPVPPSSRGTLRQNSSCSSRTTSLSSNTSSRDSGVLSPTGSRPSFDSADSFDRSLDSEDSALELSPKPHQRNMQRTISDVDEQTGEEGEGEKQEPTGEKERGGILQGNDSRVQHSCLPSPLNDNSPVGIGQTPSFQRTDSEEENIYEVVQSYRKNIKEYLGIADGQGESSEPKTNPGTLERKRKTSKQRKTSKEQKPAKVQLSRQEKLKEIKTILNEYNVTDRLNEEENVYEELDELLKKKDLMKFLGAELADQPTILAGQGVIPTLPLMRHPSMSPEEKSKRTRLKKKISILLPKIFSPKALKGEGKFHDSSEEGPESSDGSYERPPDLPKDRRAFSATVTSSPKPTRERKRSKSHPNDYFATGKDALPVMVSEEGTPEYDVPPNNSFVPFSKTNVEDDDDDDYADIEDIAPGEGISADPGPASMPLKFPIEQFQGRIQSEPDIRRETSNNIANRGAISLPCSTSLEGVVWRGTNNSATLQSESGSLTSSFELEYSKIALNRPISIFNHDPSDWEYPSGENLPDDNIYAFHNTLRKISDISETRSSRSGSFSWAIEDPERKKSEMELSTSWVKSSTLPAASVDNVDVNTTGDYMDMSGAKFHRRSRSETESSYVSMTGAFLQNRPTECTDH